MDVDDQVLNIRFKDLPDYLNDDFWWSLDIWDRYKRGGWPNGAIGWGNEPLEVTRAIFTLDRAHDKYEQERMEKDRKAAEDQAAINKSNQGSKPRINTKRRK